MKTTYQQGDVILKKVSNLPANLKKVNTNILAEGEATGHFHAICEKDSFIQKKENVDKFTFYKGDDGQTYVKIEKELDLLHQEHDKIEIQPSIYKIEIVREYDHFAEEARQVAD
ncbi:hypothetical protein GF354_05805 [Candidatus Peregrinibacteria bacterium]|nr:hypothetical protein [Candidatus Peregrinibacteria bacterium]